MFGKCYFLLLWMFWDFWDSPHPWRQCQSSLPGENLLKKHVLLLFVENGGRCLVLNGPPTPQPHPWRQCQIFLPGGKIWGKLFLMSFYDFYKKGIAKMILQLY